jgi:CheY-like chemotaxis protein
VDTRVSVPRRLICARQRPPTRGKWSRRRAAFTLGLRSLPLMQPAVRSPLPQLRQILLVATDATICQYENTSVDNFRIALVTSCDAARRLISQSAPMALITELVLPDGAGADLCRAAKALPCPPMVLVVTGDKALVPDAIDAGCDGVLLKPFCPNLLFARLGRLLRARADMPQVGEMARRFRHRSGSSRSQQGTTNEYWPDVACPHCHHQGVTSFDFASHRQAWYACLTCRTVWMDRRHD